MENNFFIDSDGRYFSHYTNWECWQSGLYRTGKLSDDLVNRCKLILEDVSLCDGCFSKVLIHWPVSSKVHLSNTTINRQAWLGHAGFCVDCGASEQEGVAAWWMITKEKQDAANSIADFYIKKFERDFFGDKKIFRKERSGRCERTYCMDF